MCSRETSGSERGFWLDTGGYKWTLAHLALWQHQMIWGFSVYPVVSHSCLRRPLGPSPPHPPDTLPGHLLYEVSTNWTSLQMVFQGWKCSDLATNVVLTLDLIGPFFTGMWKLHWCINICVILWWTPPPVSHHYVHTSCQVCYHTLLKWFMCVCCPPTLTPDGRQGTISYAYVYTHSLKQYLAHGKQNSVGVWLNE